MTSSGAEFPPLSGDIPADVQKEFVIIRDAAITLAGAAGRILEISQTAQTEKTVTSSSLATSNGRAFEEGEILQQLFITLAEQKRLAQYANDLVAEARELGVTWAQIANVAGIRPQSAYQRWNKKGREDHRKYQAGVRNRARQSTSIPTNDRPELS